MISISENEARRITSVLFQLLEKYGIENADTNYNKSFCYVDELVTFEIDDIPIFEKFIKKIFRSNCSINNKNVGKITF